MELEGLAETAKIIQAGFPVKPVALLGQARQPHQHLTEKREPCKTCRAVLVVSSRGHIDVPATTPSMRPNNSRMIRFQGGLICLFLSLSGGVGQDATAKISSSAAAVEGTDGQWR